MNKQELMEKIEKLPTFEKRDVQVKFNEEWSEQKHKAICTIDGKEAYAYVTKNYELVQFREVFTPILNDIGSEMDGFIADYNGSAIMKIFPYIDELKSGNDKFGLMAINSVDKSSSIIIKFVVERNGRQFIIPTKIAGLRKQHSQGAKNLIKDYLSMVGKVKSVWDNIVTEFPKYKIVKVNNSDPQSIELSMVLKKLKLGKKTSKKLEENLEQLTIDGKNYTLWDMFIDILEMFNNKKYKSEVLREKKIDNICQLIFELSFLFGI